MPGPLCRCPRGHTFESRAISIENSSGITFEDCGETCPFCGSMARIVDGTYDFFPDFIRITVASSASAEDRAAVEGFLAALRTRKTAPTPEELDDAFPDVPAEVLSVFKKLVESMDWGKARSAIAWLLGIYLTVHLSKGTDERIEDLRDDVRRSQEQTEIVDERIRQIQEEWREWQSRGDVTVRQPSPRANPKGTPPRIPEHTRRPKRRRR